MRGDPRRPCWGYRVGGAGCGTVWVCMSDERVYEQERVRSVDVRDKERCRLTVDVRALSVECCRVGQKAYYY